MPGKRRLEIEIHKSRSLVPGEGRAHHALIDEREERLSRHSEALCEHGDLGKALGHYAKKEVVADLHQSGHLAVTDIGDTCAVVLQIRGDVIERLWIP